MYSLGRRSEGEEKPNLVPEPDPGAPADGMGLQAGRSALWSPGAEGPRRGIVQLLPLLLLLLLRPGFGGAAAPGEAEAPTLYLWKTGKWDGVPPSSYFTSGSTL